MCKVNLSIAPKFAGLIVLDNQTQLLPELREYINIRRTMFAMTKPKTPPTGNLIHSDPPADPPRKVVLPNGHSAANRISSPIPAVSAHGNDTPMEVDTPGAAPEVNPMLVSSEIIQDDISIPHNLQTDTRIPSTPPQPHALEVDTGSKTARELLMRIACLSEEIMRHSEEKVNLAQAAYDSVSYCRSSAHSFPNSVVGGQTHKTDGPSYHRARNCVAQRAVNRFRREFTRNSTTR